MTTGGLNAVAQVGDPGFDLSAVPSLEVAYEQAQRAVDSTLEHADSLDAKAGILITAASFAIAGAAGLQAIMASHPTTVETVYVVHALAFLVAATYLVVVLCAFRAFLTHRYRSAPDPRDIMSRRLTWHEARTKLKITEDLLDAFTENYEALQDKEAWLRVALVATLCQSLMVGIILVTIAFAL